MKITHSIPRHDCFSIMQPARGNYKARCYLVNREAGEVYDLEDINTHEVQQAVLLDYYEFKLNDLPDSLSYLVYGQNSDEIKRALRVKYPELNSDSKIEILILMKK